MDNNGWRSAKPQKKTKAQKRNDQKMRNSYFTQQYNAMGEDFVNFKNSQDIKRDSYKIFRDLANGAIDLSKHGKCFNDPVFLGVLINVAYEKMSYHYASQLGLEIFINNSLMNNMQVEGFIYEAYSSHQRSAEAYSLIYQCLSNINITHDYVSQLSTLIPLLNQYRFSL